MPDFVVRKIHDWATNYHMTRWTACLLIIQTVLSKLISWINKIAQADIFIKTRLQNISGGIDLVFFCELLVKCVFQRKAHCSRGKLFIICKDTVYFFLKNRFGIKNSSTWECAPINTNLSSGIQKNNLMIKKNIYYTIHNFVKLFEYSHDLFVQSFMTYEHHLQRDN